MKILTPTDKFIVTHTLTDGEQDQYIRAKIFNKELDDVTPNGTYIILSHVYGGMYAYKHGAGFPIGKYIVVFEVYSDSGYATYSKKYGISEENIWVSDFLNAILTEIPDNILLDDDARLDNLPLIPNLANEATLTGVEANVIEQIRDVVNDSDGGAV